MRTESHTLLSAIFWSDTQARDASKRSGRRKFTRSAYLTFAASIVSRIDSISASSL